jgi:hypothetical protein
MCRRYAWLELAAKIKVEKRGFCVHRGPQRLLALWPFLLSPSEILI